MVERNVLAVAAVGVVLVASVVGAAYVTGIGDTLFGDGEAQTPTPAQTPTVRSTPTPAAANGGGEPTANGGSDGGGATPTPKAYDFQFRILNTEPCGRTCRDVTVRLTNRGAKTATGVTAKSRILADGDQIWSGTENIGRVQSGESVTRTKRVKLGVFDAAKVQQNNGYVTIKTTVAWDGGSRTFTERIKAA